MDGMPDWAEGDKAYEAYFEASAVSNFTPQETIKYDKDMMTERDRINSINYARQEGREEGEQAGLQKGLRKGREEGREEGLQEGERKGREVGLMEGELKKQREIASALKAKGVDAGTISVCTGLSLDDVAKL
jgi:flagellar biosynthesis/type III secretory pathway protein FliH